MNVEHQTYGFLNDWHLPSPKSTPKSGNCHAAASVTPRNEPTSSHFLDAFVTPRANGQQTPAQTPVYNSPRITGTPSSSQGRPKPSPRDPEFHVNHFTTTTLLPLPPVSPSRRLSSSPGPASAKNLGEVQRSFSGTENAAARAMHSFQMQTPPPTRDSSSRRDVQPYQGEQQVEAPPTIFSRTFIATGNQASTQAQVQAIQPAFQFSGLPFSPDVYQFPGNVPPANIQQILSWDQGLSINTADTEMSNATNDPFSASAEPAGAWDGNGHRMSNMQNIPQRSNSFHASSQESDYWTKSNISLQATNSFQPDLSNTSGVNPSLLFSFSDPPDMIGFQEPKSQFAKKRPDFEGRQPYEHQTRESVRESELARQARQQHTRTETTSSSGSTQSLPRPGGLRRSNTDSGFRRVNRQSTESGSSSFSVDQAHIPRNPSPLKRLSQASLTSIPESIRSRPRTRLVIDETGRARTETIPSDESSNDVTKSSFWNLNDGSDSDSDTSIHVPSQRSSFIISTDQPRKAKHMRVDSDQDVSQLPRPSSSTSTHSLNFRTVRSGFGGLLGSKTIRNSSSDVRRHSMASFGGSLRTALDLETLFSPPTEKNDTGAAQLALKQVRQDRMRKHESNSPQDVLKAHNQRWSQASLDLNAHFFSFDQLTSPTPHVNISPTHTASTNISPIRANDDGVATPTTSHSTSSNSSTRCVCNSIDNGDGYMIQCESCTKWLHVACVGLNTIPGVYVCVFCTGQTPLARGGRIREPLRMQQAQNQWASPLGYKSTGEYRR